MAQASVFRKLGLLIYKNLLLRMRQWVVTIFEVFFSLILGGIFVFVVFNFNPEDRGHPRDYDPKYKAPRPEDRYSQSMSKFEEALSSSACELTFAYAPSTPDTDDVMDNLAKAFCSDGGLKMEKMASAKELETEYYNKWINNVNFKGAIIFNDGVKGDKEGKIRLTLRVPAKGIHSTDYLYPQPGSGDYNLIGPSEEGIRKYKENGMLALQWGIEQELSKSMGLRDPSIKLMSMPYPKFEKPIRSGGIYHPAVHVLCMFVMWSTCFLLVSITRNVVAEKQTGVSELLRLTGVPGWLQWISWLIHMFLPHIITIFGLTLITSGLTYQKNLPLLGTNVMLLVFVLFFFLVHNIALGFLICTVFRKPIIASTVAVLYALGTMVFGVYYGLFMGYTTLGYAVRVIAAIVSPNFALSAHFVNMRFLDISAVDDSDTAPGATFSNLGEYHYVVPDNVSMGTLILIQLMSSLAYFLLTAYLDAVLPSEYGVRKPWHYFQCARGRRQTSVAPEPSAAAAPSVTSGEAQATESGEAQATEPGEVVADEPPKISDSKLDKRSVKSSKSKKEVTETSVVSLLPSSFEPVSEEGRTVGVEICDLFKKFGTKTAVNGVSFKMFAGDIFALLGHNGAGKTTLISMLTGFFSPTSGTAYVDGYDIRDSLEKARESMGLCPQHNMKS